MKNLFTILAMANKPWVLLLVAISVTQMAITNPVDAYTLFTNREAWLTAVAELPILEENFNSIPNDEYQAGTIPSDVFTNLELFPQFPLPMAIMGGSVVPVFNRDFSVQMLFFQPALAVGLDIINPETIYFQYTISEEQSSGAFNFGGESRNIDFLGWVADEGDSPVLQTFVFFDPASRSVFSWDNLLVVTGPGVSVTIDIKPRVFNLKSKGKKIISWIKLPEEYDPHDIARGSLELSIPSCSYCEVIYPTCEFPLWKRYLAFFPRQGLIDEIEIMNLELPAKLDLIITGELDDGTLFEGSDTIRVIKQKKWTKRK